MTGTRRRRWYQYRLRTLLLLTTLTALVLSYVAWRQSTREQRELQRAIRESGFMSEGEKDLFCALVWQRDGEELLEHLLWSVSSESEPSPFLLEVNRQLVGALTWHTSLVDAQGRPRCVFPFSGGGSGFGSNLGTIVLTDDRNRLIQWKQVRVGGDVKCASVRPSEGAIELSIIADSLGTLPFFRRGTYRFLLDDNGIIEHGVEWDVAFDRSSRQQATEQLIADQRLPTGADEVSHGDSKRKTETP